jgi:excisionase family DNA binding protein
MTNFMTSREVAAALGVSVRQVPRLIERGELTPVEKLPGRTGAYIFDAAALTDDTEK